MSDLPPDNELSELRDAARCLQSDLDSIKQRLDAIERRALFSRLTTPAEPKNQPLSYEGTSPPEPSPAAVVPVSPFSIRDQVPADTSFEKTIEETPSPDQEGGVEAQIGSIWLNRIGAIVLLCGIGFFVKYSFEQGWISPTTRVLIGAAAGAGLVAGGLFFLRRGMQPFAVGLLGAGIAALYSSSFAAYYFYSLISTQTAFALLFMVTAMSTGIAIRGRLLTIAVLALLGGFWTPVALSTGENKQVELLTYLLILDVGFLITGLVRQWRALGLLSWIGTLVLFGGWYSKFYADDALYRTLGFIVVLYLLFHVESLLWARRPSAFIHRWTTTLVHLNNGVFFSCFYFIARDQLDSWMGLFCIATGLFQWLSCRVVPRAIDSVDAVRSAFLLDGAAILMFFAPIQFDRHWVPMTWSAQSALTVAFCRTRADIWLRIKGVGLLVASLAHLLAYERWSPERTERWWQFGNLFLTDYLVLLLTVGIAAYLGAVMLLSHRKATADFDRRLSRCLLIFGSVVFLATFAGHYERFLASWCWMGLACSWLFLVGRKDGAVGISIALVVAVYVKFMLWDTLGAGLSGEWEAITGIALNRAVLTGLLAAALTTAAIPPAARALQGADSNAWIIKFLGGAAPSGALVFTALMLVTWTGTFEILRVFRFEPWRLRYSNPLDVEGVYITAFWMVNALIIWLTFGTRIHAATLYALLLTIASSVRLAFADTLGAVAEDSWAQLQGVGTNRVFLVGTGVIVLGFVTYRAISRLNPESTWFAQASIRTAFVVLPTILCIWLATFEIVRAFRFEEFRFRFHDPHLAMHVVLSVFWSVAGIIMLAIGFARRINALRYLALGLFGLTLVKVLLVDLSNLKMAYRIISFIVLGVLLLFASFLYQKLSSRIVAGTGKGPS